MNGIQPKCGPTVGGSPLELAINLENIPSQYLFSLTVGFQAKSAVDPNVKKSRKKNQNRGMENSRFSEFEDDAKSVVQMGGGTGTSINPMDINVNDSQLEKSNWYCSFGSYENEVIYCSIPKIDNFQQAQVEYNVDISLNGQQFSGFPMIYRFYEIKDPSIEPNISSVEGGTIMKILGSGFFDSVTKKARISCSNYEDRFTDLQWDRNEKILLLVTPPLSWIVNDDESLKNLKNKEIYEKFVFLVDVTLNNIDWIRVGEYRYLDPIVNRISYTGFPEGVFDKDKRKETIFNEEGLTNDEKIYFGIAPKPSDNKKYDEIVKKFNEEDFQITLPRRAYNGLYLFGDFFPNTKVIIEI